MDNLVMEKFTQKIDYNAKTVTMLQALPLQSSNPKILQTLPLQSSKPKLLLHTCCAVCAAGVLARTFSVGVNPPQTLSDFFNITLYFYNPNIDTQTEHDLRAGELVKLLPRFSVANTVIVPYTQTVYNHCTDCIGARLTHTNGYAIAHNYPYVSTVLSVSPHKNAEVINSLGSALCALSHAPTWLFADFKKQNGFKLAGEVASKINLYRQNYCGCGKS